MPNEQTVQVMPDDVCATTIYAALRRAVMTVPDNEVLVNALGRYSYRELLADTDHLRCCLFETGVRPGDHVGICMGNTYEWLSLFFAISSLGAVVVPINTRFKAHEFGYAVAQSKMKVLFMQSRVLTNDFLTMIRAVIPEVDSGLPGAAAPALGKVVVLGDEVPSAAISWDDFTGFSGPWVEAACKPGDAALIQYTSGTTAYPKGVLLSHRSMCANGFFAGVRIGLRAGDRFHSARPFFHVAGTTLSILACVQHMVTLITMSKFAAEEALELLEAEKCTHFSGNDTMALMLVNHPRRSEYRLSLRGAWIAASPPVVAAVMDELGARECVVAYGLSEASPNVAMSGWWEPEKLRRTASMLPEPGVEVTIRDVEGEVLPPGTVGEIWVRGWNTMIGYYDMPDETRKAVDDDRWLHTGDQGTMDDIGRLTFRGRLKETLRIGGENVSPAEVEDVLLGHSGVQQVVVVGVPDERLIEVACALVVIKDGHPRPTGDEIKNWTAERLSGFKVPRHVLFLSGFDEIGMTASSKVPRRFATDYALSVLKSGE